MLDFFKKEIVVHSPVEGEIIGLDAVPDEVFASKMMGEGVGFLNEDNKIYSPVNGAVMFVANTKHAIGLKTNNGIELLIHAGLDSVELQGEGFQVYVKAGDHVKKGQLLLSYDKQVMNAHNINMITPMVITNSSKWKIEILKSHGKVKKDVEILKVRK